MDLLAIDFESDNGWITSSTSTKEMISYESSHIDYISPGYGNGAFFVMDVSMSGNKATYSRQYQRIQSVLAQISGTMNLFILLIGILAVPYARSNMFENLTNEAYKIVEKSNTRQSPKNKVEEKQSLAKEPQGDHVKRKDQEMTPLVSFHNTSRKIHPDPKSNAEVDNHPMFVEKLEKEHTAQPLEPQNGSNLLKQGSEVKIAYLGPKIEANATNAAIVPQSSNAEEIRTLLSQERSPQGFDLADLESPTKVIGDNNVKQPLNSGDTTTKVTPTNTETPEGPSTTFKEWFISVFKPSAKSKVLTRGKSEVLRQIDIFSIIRRFQEVDNLKACLLTQHQRVLFENIAKPSLVYDKSLNPRVKNFVTVKGWDQSFRGDKEKLLQAYRGLMQLEKRTEMDEQIIGLYENSLNEDEYKELRALF